jgi:putative membrane protein
MAGLIARWLSFAIGIWLTARIVPGFSVRSFGTAVWVAALLGVLHMLVGWLLFVAIGLGTLGIGFLLAFATRWLVTALLLVSIDAMLKSFVMKNFGVALLGSVVLTTIASLTDALLKRFL